MRALAHKLSPPPEIHLPIHWGKLNPQPIPYFFRSRFALAVAPWSHGAISEAIDICPKLDISVSPVDIAAAAFSVTISWYSAGEH